MAPSSPVTLRFASGCTTALALGALLAGVAGTVQGQDGPLTAVALGPGGSRFDAAMRPAGVQRLLLALAAAPRAAGFVDSALVGTGVSRPELEALHLIRRDGAGYALSFTLLTQADVRRIREVGEVYARSLADAVLARRSAISALVRRYDVRSVDPAAVAFVLVGCFSLDWDGLSLTAQQGYRATPPTQLDGRYVPWAEERGAVSVNAWPDARGHPSLKRIYWGSHTTSADDVAFTSFGDHASLPRATLPDAIWPLQNALGAAELPDALGPSLRPLAEQSLLDLLRDMGHVLVALREGAADGEAVANAAGVPPDRAHALLGALVRLAYVDSAGGDRYVLRVPVFTARDGPMIDSVRALGRATMDAWLAAHYAKLARDLASLTPQRYGVPFADGFMQVWHYLFGSATRDLVEAGMLADPYDARREHWGFIPFVWQQLPHDSSE